MRNFSPLPPFPQRIMSTRLPSQTPRSGKPFCFSLLGEGERRTYLLVPDSAHLMNQWIRVLSTTIAVLPPDDGSDDAIARALSRTPGRA